MAILLGAPSHWSAVRDRRSTLRKGRMTGPCASPAGLLCIYIYSSLAPHSLAAGTYSPVPLTFLPPSPKGGPLIPLASSIPHYPGTGAATPQYYVVIAGTRNRTEDFKVKLRNLCKRQALYPPKRTDDRSVC